MRIAPRRVLAAGVLVAGLAGLTACGSDDGPAPAASSAAPSTSASTSTSRSTSATAVPTPTTSRTSGAIPPIAGGPTGPAHADPAAVRAAAAPVRIRVPSIGVTSKLDALGLKPDGVLATPPHFPVAAWYAGGVRPGDTGPAVIVGHVDSVSGPAVFYRLRDLRVGAAVYVDRADGSTVRFVVARSDEYPKRTFPTQAVYGPSPLPTLRLVTCAGDFNRAKHSYVDNLVVTAYEG